MLIVISILQVLFWGAQSFRRNSIVGLWFLQRWENIANIFHEQRILSYCLLQTQKRPQEKRLNAAFEGDAADFGAERRLLCISHIHRRLQTFNFELFACICCSKNGLASARFSAGDQCREHVCEILLEGILLSSVCCGLGILRGSRSSWSLVRRNKLSNVSPAESVRLVVDHKVIHIFHLSIPWH